MTILITGTTGNVGQPTVEALVESGEPVRAAVRDLDDAERLPDGVEPVVFDFTDPSTWAAAYDGVDRMFLMRPPPISNIERDMLPSLEAAQKAGVEHVVLLSLLGAEKNPVVPHRKLEDWLVPSPMSYTFLRPSFFMQNLSTTHLEDIRDRDEIFVPAGDGKTSFIDARDIGEVAAMALADPDAHRDIAYPLTGSEALSYGQVADIFSEVLGRKISYPKPGAIRFAWRMKKRGMSLPFVGVMTALYTVCRLGKADTVTNDLERLLGRPPISMRQFVGDHREAFSRG
ncbi:SDR family oxidoreductase [Persicimonas caeni]|uniref:SDR family oxidoreductase n=1 Tax=Persicimonas caeni TaxID=2292766 RepID=A0A4Y6PS46_PERCE|nr:SDR family oxidoreductase [Persicimonas caeni]QDG50939.1 SDR family oxidoreductase [Persicimonas caeni]QED32160.1 SDR family oxidoreductase [Persicimonas caeni]